MAARKKQANALVLVRALLGKPYNVGSDESVSIRDLADRISRIIGNGKYTILGHADTVWNPGRYVPDNDLVSRDLGLYRSVSLDEGHPSNRALEPMEGALIS